MRAVALLLVGTLALAACGGSDEPETAPPAYRIEPACPEGPRHVDGLTVDLLNRVVASADLPAWQAADIGASVQLRDQRMVWVFGDTIRSSSLSPRMVANSMLVSSGTCVAQVRTATDGPVVPDARPGVVRWPMSIVAMQPIHDGLMAEHPEVTEILVVLCARTRRGTEGSLDHTFLGTDAAVFTVTPDGPPELFEIMAISPDDEALDQVNWGAASTVHGRWFYLFGTRQTGHDFGRELYVGRAPVADPTDRSRWQFWDGSTWGASMAAAAAVLPAQGGVSQTLSVDHLDGLWVAVSKRDGDLGDFVYVWTAPTPYGPWTPQRGVAAPAGFDTGRLQYAPLAHPEVPLANGNLLVSISRNTTDPQRLLDDPEVGRPVFAEVERP
jgi:Domain of unknown function (DUF4185)